MEIDARQIFSSLKFSWVLASFIIFVSALVLSKGVKYLKEKLKRNIPHYRFFIEQVSSVIEFSIILLGLSIAILAIFGFKKEVVFAIGGSLAVAVGFGLKDVAASILSGFMILFERPYQVGDRIKFNNIYGDVIAIGLRSTQVRTLSDSIVTIPNNLFITQSVSSGNAGELDMMVEYDIYISHKNDLSKVESIVRESLTSSRYIYLKKPFYIFFKNKFIEHHYCTQIKIKAYVIETKYEVPFISDITKRLTSSFKQNEILYPYSTDHKK